ncbi:MAG TPA: membrane protein insertion efficiency factor YidD, partial [Synergistaceae bacterium]|nr:membrane protein insertion efficiency factor YidD [Synergistaceae bacterium]
MKGLPTRAAVKVIRFYQRFISPLLGDRCRVYPSCSSYAIQGIERFGLARGTVLAFLR